MSAAIAIYGRLGGDPEERTSQSGTTWAKASIAVQLGSDDDRAPTWLSLIAFGRAAEILCRHGKGDLLSASGRLQLNRWTDRDGNEREVLQVVADTIISARSVRPGGQRSTNRTQGSGQYRPEHHQHSTGPLDDDLVDVGAARKDSYHG